jgi:hypothetical protein
MISQLPERFFKLDAEFADAHLGALAFELAQEPCCNRKHHGAMEKAIYRAGIPSPWRVVMGF